MLEYIEFYTKNLSNFTILLLIGALIAILDITFRNVIKDVYLNVRDNIKKRHGIGNGVSTAGIEGMENSDRGGDESCPKECNAVEALRTKLSSLIENAAKLQKDIQDNNETIKKQQKTIENLERNIDKMSKKG
jgi:peptidoglycan hydrolase CwlO-like protein